eukprot:1447108-Rhodomonas_salina.2
MVDRREGVSRVDPYGVDRPAATLCIVELPLESLKLAQRTPVPPTSLLFFLNHTVFLHGSESDRTLEFIGDPIRPGSLSKRQTLEEVVEVGGTDLIQHVGVVVCRNAVTTLEDRRRELGSGRSQAWGCNVAESLALVAIALDVPALFSSVGKTVHLSAGGLHVFRAARQCAHGVGGEEVFDGSEFVVNVGHQPRRCWEHSSNA